MRRGIHIFYSYSRFFIDDSDGNDSMAEDNEFKNKCTVINGDEEDAGNNDGVDSSLVESVPFIASETNSK